MGISIEINSKEFQAEIQKALKPLIQHMDERFDLLIKHLQSVVGTKYLTVEEFSKAVGRSSKTIRNHIDAGRISYDQPDKGCKILIPASEILKFKQI